MSAMSGLRVLGAMVLAIAVAAAQEPKPPAAGGGGDAAAPKAPTDKKDEWPSDFARFVTEGDGGHFDTAITTYRNRDGVVVTLYAAVHVADGACYQLLGERFTRHEALLYELVGPSDYRPKKGAERGGSFVSMMQTALKNGLELEFQLDGIDYSAANFVHADMTGAEFEQSMAERGENLFAMLMQLGINAQKEMMKAAAERAEAEGDDQPAAKGSDFDLVRAFRSGEGRHQMRMMMAQQLESMETAAAGGDGSTLLEGRNEKCLEVLQQQIASGKKNLGIYYGGAHLTHMEQRLCKDLGFQKVDHEWIVAWDCKKRLDPKADRELWRQRRQAQKDIEGIRDAALRWRADHADKLPKLEDLAATKDGAPYWAGAVVDPWGHGYTLAGYDRRPYIVVSSSGQDGQVGNADDMHSATVRELRRLGGAPRVAPGGRIDDTELEPSKAVLAEIQLKSIHEMTRLFRMRKGSLPTMADLVAKDERGQAMYDGPINDPWGHAYELRHLADDRCEVRSAGPDGAMDTADDCVVPKPQRR